MNKSEEFENFISWLATETGISKEDILNTFKILESTTEIQEEEIVDMFANISSDIYAFDLFNCLYNNRFSELSTFILQYAMVQDDYTVNNFKALCDMWTEFDLRGEGGTLIDSMHFAQVRSRKDPSGYYLSLTNNEIRRLTLIIDRCYDRNLYKVNLYAKGLFTYSVDELSLVIEHPVPGILNVRTMTYVDTMIDSVVRKFNSDFELLENDDYGFNIYTFFAQNMTYIDKFDHKVLREGHIGLEDILENMYGEHNESTYEDDSIRAYIISLMQKRNASLSFIERVDRLIAYLKNFDNYQNLLTLAFDHETLCTIEELTEMTKTTNLLEIMIWSTQIYDKFWQVVNFYKLCLAFEDDLLVYKMVDKIYDPKMAQDRSHAFQYLIPIVKECKSHPYKEEILVNNIMHKNIDTFELLTVVDDKELITWSLALQMWDICCAISKTKFEYSRLIDRYDMSSIIKSMSDNWDLLKDMTTQECEGLFEKATSTRSVLRKIEIFISAINNPSSSKVLFTETLDKALKLSDEEKRELIKKLT